MRFYLNPSSGVPVYLQIVEQVRSAVGAGTLRAGDKLPSVREMAALLAINPNTVAWAYGEPEREGVLRTAAGKGCYVARHAPSLGPAERTARIREAVRRLVAEAWRLGEEPREVLAVVAAEIGAADSGRDVERSRRERGGGSLGARR